MSDLNRWHVGRAWEGHEPEDACPCEQASCGLAVGLNPECDQHGLHAARTIRQSHPEWACPANPQPRTEAERVQLQWESDRRARIQERLRAGG